MLKEVRYENWKSYKEATLHIDPLTVLIGTNASGKSNALDGLAFLNRAVQGSSLQMALTGDSTILLDSTLNAIRGGVEWAARKPGDTFCLKALVQFEANVDYEYKIVVKASQQVELLSESLAIIKYQPGTSKRTILFEADIEQDNSPIIMVSINEGKKGRPKKDQFKRSVSVISQLAGQKFSKEIERGIECIVTTLENVFILDPVPALMRDYKPFSSQLATNASNLAGMLAALPKIEKTYIESLLSKYVSRLPEGDIRKVWAEPVGRFKNDAMLYCREKWAEIEKPLEVDARGMSDGTLRFLGILTALLTRPEGTLIIIEEVDNGLHPSRAHLLLEMLKEIGKERRIDILVTTHNPALMDELGPEMIPFIVVAHRSRETGESKLTMLEDINNLPKLLAYGPLGKISARGIIEENLSKKGGITCEK